MRASIDQNVKKSIDFLIGGVHSLGSVLGSLDAITLHNRNEFRIWEYNSGRPVACRFRKPMLPAVIERLEQRVLVYGEISRNARGEPVLITVEGMQPWPDTSELPTIREMSGFLEDPTDGKPLKEHMEDL